MNKLVVTGSLAFDYIMHFPGSYSDNILPDKINSLSVSFLADKFAKNFGGVAGNIAYTLGLLGQTSTILSSAGIKDFSEYYDHLKAAGVDVSQVHLAENMFSANAFIMTDRSNSQIAGFYPGAMSEDVYLQLGSAAPDFVIIAPTIPQAMINFVLEAKKMGVPYLYDPAQQVPSMSAENLENGVNGAEIIIGNEYEIALILEKTGYTKEKLLEHTKVLITTLGDKGSRIETKKEVTPIGIVSPARQVADPTGAGDAYIAGFLAGYFKKLPLKTCGQMGANAASFSIEEYGTQIHFFTPTEFDDRYKRSFGELPGIAEKK